jgi:hypothetical protein
MLDAPRQQLARVSSRLTHASGLSSIELAADLIAFGYVATSAALETALTEAVATATERLQQMNRSSLTPVQLAAVTEAGFIAFRDGERARGRHDVKRAMSLRANLAEELRGERIRGKASSALETTGTPHPEHFRLFLQLTTGGADPRGSDADPPLGRLVARVAQIRGPRGDFAHGCVEAASHPLVVGRGLPEDGLASSVRAMQEALGDLQKLLHVLELCCLAL